MRDRFSHLCPLSPTTYHNYTQVSLGIKMDWGARVLQKPAGRVQNRIEQEKTEETENLTRIASPFSRFAPVQERLGDAVQVLIGAQIDRPADKGRRSEHRFAQGVRAQDLRLVAEPQDRGEAILVDEVNFAVGGDRRGREGAF